MKFIIIGSNGFLGGEMRDYLNRSGHNVYCYDYIGNDVKFVDVRKRASLLDIDWNVDCVILMSAKTGTKNGFSQFEDFLAVNELGLINVLDSIKASSFRPHIIFPSTRLVYAGSDRSLSEDAEKMPKTLYAINKLACESILSIYMNMYEIPYTVFRICVPFGELNSAGTSFGTVGFFINQARTNNRITLFGDGSAKRTFTFTRDICEIFLRSAGQSKLYGEVFNIGGQTLCLRDLAEIVAKEYLAKVQFTDWPNDDLKLETGSTFFNDQKLQNFLGEIVYTKLSSLFRGRSFLHT